MRIEVKDKSNKQIIREVDEHNSKIEASNDRHFNNEYEAAIKEDYTRVAGIEWTTVSTEARFPVCHYCRDHFVYDGYSKDGCSFCRDLELLQLAWVCVKARTSWLRRLLRKLKKPKVYARFERQPHGWGRNEKGLVR